MTNYDEPTVIEKLLAEKKVKVKTFTVEDVIDMLESLRFDIEELDYPKDCDYACNGCLYWGDVDKLIDEKINALRGENETC